LKPDGGTTYTQFECFQQLDGLWTAEPPPYDTTSTPPTDTTSSTASESSGETSAPPSDDSGSSSSNAGPIAGGVVGGVAALGIAGAAFWFFRRKKQQKASAAAAASQGEYSELPKTSPTTKPDSQQVFEMEDQRHGVGVARQELPPQQGIAEAPGDERMEPPAELP
jgi:uncharacterized protein HemX